MTISFREDLVAGSVTQLLNVLFGNISIKRGIKITRLDFSDGLLSSIGGPGFGIGGIRQRLSIYRRPLACTALKPIGLSSAEIAGMAGAYAAGGLDLIKDDHGMGDIAAHPYEDRVARCQAAVAEANAKTGGKTIYFPMINGGFDAIERQVAFAKQRGCEGFLAAPLLIGCDTVRAMAKRYNMMVMAHPAFTGTHFHDPEHGMTPAVLLGTIFRLIGSDISVFPNFGGRFSFTETECRALADDLRSPLGAIKPAFPAPAGGMKIKNVEAMARAFGHETVFIIGGALMQHSKDLRHNASVFMNAIREHFGEEREK